MSRETRRFLQGNNCISFLHSICLDSTTKNHDRYLSSPIPFEHFLIKHDKLVSIQQVFWYVVIDKGVIGHRNLTERLYPMVVGSLHLAGGCLLML